MDMTQPPYPAPDFSLKDSEGKLHTLKDFKGKWLVLYFYPEDDTPGCTIEACSMRDARDDLMKLGADVVGISKDDASSHEAFKAKHSLNFTLLSDPDLTAIKAYGCWGKKMFGIEGVLRRTFIISPDGTVVKVFGRVTVIDHGNKVIEALQDLIK
jgi:thioredoxin-dependent peroxiredoxin